MDATSLPTGIGVDVGSGVSIGAGTGVAVGVAVAVGAVAGSCVGATTRVGVGVGDGTGVSVGAGTSVGVAVGVGAEPRPLQAASAPARSSRAKADCLIGSSIRSYVKSYLAELPASLLRGADAEQLCQR